MRNYSVLIVDDNRDWCAVLGAEIAKNSCFDVLAPTHNGKDAIECLAEKKPDILILDMIVPEFDGLYILNYIRNSLQGYQPFVYILSAIGSGRTSQIIQNLEVDYYSIKPIQAKAVASNLSQLIAIDDNKRPPAVNYYSQPAAMGSIADQLPAINLSNQIDNYLFEIGAPLNRLSTKCSRMALEICLSDEVYLSSIKTIYKMVADMSNPPTTIGSIERNIRSTVQNVQKAGTAYFKQCFPDGQKKLTNTQFIDISVYIIKRRIEEFLSDKASVRKNSEIHRE